MPLIESYFCDGKFDDGMKWKKVHVVLNDKNGKTIVDKVVEAPSGWSEQSIQIAASKYLYGGEDDSIRESSIRELVHRVSRTIADKGLEYGYFKDKEECEVFYNELSWLVTNQRLAFNSPIFFNVGLAQEYGLKETSENGFFCADEKTGEIIPTRDIRSRPQGSACFILGVDDNMQSIMERAANEAKIFKWGSGCGANSSSLRSTYEKLSGGGIPSGPISFMRIFDQTAGVVRSGGKLRRAAKMEILNIDHPDILAFIQVKMEEEAKARALILAGYTDGLDGTAYDSVMFQNSNFSVRVTDDFMTAVINDEIWQTKTVTSGETVKEYKAKYLMRSIAESAWACGDPGIQFHDVFNKWNTCKASGILKSTNPCSEFAFIERNKTTGAVGGACNLSSHNLLKFWDDEKKEFDFDSYGRAIDIAVIAMDIIVTLSSYPTFGIAQNANDFRPIGLGYANLGALLISAGLPYDSDDGRDFASAITSFMTARAYVESSLIAKQLVAFKEWEPNAESMRDVLTMHCDAHNARAAKSSNAYLFEAASNEWEHALSASNGYRNAAVSCLAPTGTISFLMGAETTGVEPAYALVTMKQLAGGGSMKLVVQSVRNGLVALGYDEESISTIMQHLHSENTLRGAPLLKDEHLAVFATAGGDNSISYSGHIQMLAALQPLISMSISKTVNVPESVTVDEIEKIYIESWEIGLKSVAVFRDKCKTSPLSSIEKQKVESNEIRPVPRRYKLPETCETVRHRFEIGPQKGYFHLGLFPDGTPGELFVTMNKQGTTVRGLFDAFSIAISNCLQYGVPLERLVEKFSYMRFEPSGWTPNSDVPYAQSPVDYIFRWIGKKYLSGDVPSPELTNIEQEAEIVEKKPKLVDGIPADEGRVCAKCGHFPLQRSGKCYVCPMCGETTGCS